MNKKVLLLILDGWGIAKNKDVSAPDKAKTPNFNDLLENNPSNYLITHGEKVGLPIGQMGNSEVGHMNIGSGRLFLQDLLKINESIDKGRFHTKEHFQDIISYSKKNSSNIHLIGLVSDGGVHSNIDHLKEIIISLSDVKDKIFIHAFTDGRDVDPKSGVNYIETLESFCKENGELEFNHKLNTDKNPKGYKAWFLHSKREMENHKIFFGHWSTLQNIKKKNIYPMDHGCIWGGKLSAYNLTKNKIISQQSLES